MKLFKSCNVIETNKIFNMLIVNESKLLRFVLQFKEILQSCSFKKPELCLRNPFDFATLILTIRKSFETQKIINLKHNLTLRQTSLVENIFFLSLFVLSKSFEK